MKQRTIENFMYTMIKNGFGEPYKEVEEYFSNKDSKNKDVLDVGSGQGRNSLMLSDFGFNVTSIDLSRVGIKQMQERARERYLSIEGIEGDVLEYEFTKRFDYILVDMVLHTFKSKENVQFFLKKMRHIIKNNGEMCMIFPIEDEVYEYAKGIVNKTEEQWVEVSSSMIRVTHKMFGLTRKFEFAMYVIKNKDV
ncbi:class I SAM-dependent methyltransferase [Anaeromicrobium sediminis]|nr:class I SAM-dependent methyltransferase [Anaeromicrobium sediminis]